MAPGRRSGPSGPKAGTLVTGIVVAQARKGVLVEVGGRELLLARTRWGAAADDLADASYGHPITVEVVAAGGGAGGAAGGSLALTRIGVERSLRQPRTIEATFQLTDGGVLVPLDGSDRFAARLLDEVDPGRFDGRQGSWAVGAPLLGVRLIALQVDLA